MKVERIEVFVEELSMEMALRALLPKIVGNTSFEVYSHQGKQDLLAKLPDRLRAYAGWVPKTWRIVVIVDRDDADCAKLKAELEKIAVAAKLTTRSGARGKGYVVVNRIAIEELEAWYFGDWQAVRASYPRQFPRRESTGTPTGLPVERGRRSSECFRRRDTLSKAWRRSRLRERSRHTCLRSATRPGAFRCFARR